MAEITQITRPSLASFVGTIPSGHQFTPLVAGENIGAGDACRISPSTGKVVKSIGTAINAASVVIGFAVTDVNAGEPMSLFWNEVLNYADSSAITSGNPLFLSASVAGGLATTAGATGAKPVAFGLPDGCVYLLQDIH